MPSKSKNSNYELVICIVIILFVHFISFLVFFSLFVRKLHACQCSMHADAVMFVSRKIRSYAFVYEVATWKFPCNWRTSITLLCNRRTYVLLGTRCWERHSNHTPSYRTTSTGTGSTNSRLRWFAFCDWSEDLMKATSCWVAFLPVRFWPSLNQHDFVTPQRPIDVINYSGAL